MRKFAMSFLLSLLVLTVLWTLTEIGVGAEIKIIKVSNPLEFLEALNSDRVIELRPGKYNLSEWDPIFNKQPEQSPPYSNLKNKGNPKLAQGVSWSKEPFDGGELVLTGIKNLTIRGMNAKDKSEIIVDPRYAFVLKFANCSNIVIERLTAGHSEGGYCMGGVFSFSDSSRITITGANMYGCGTVGLELLNVSDMKITSSQIYECTYGIMTVVYGSNIAFEKCAFRDNQEFTLIGVSGTKNISFANCEFINNNGEMFAVVDTTVSVSDSTFKGNRTEEPIKNSNNVLFKNCVFD